jgi:hypothetical protein
MATLLLGAAGTALGGAVGGSLLGLSAASLGGMIGSTLGGLVDSWVIASLQPGQRYEGARLDATRITSATEGAVIPRVHGTARFGGNIVWATDFCEETREATQGGKGGGGRVTTTEYAYSASFAIAVCDGPITGIGRVWADGAPLDTTAFTWRWYPGSEDQEPDPAIVAAMGADATPAYRGTAYAVFEDLPLGEFGNRLPQLTFEVFAPIADPDTAEGMVRAVTLIPATGEFAYATQLVRSESGAVNANAAEDRADLLISLDQLEALAPQVESVSLVVSWFGTDLRAGHCAILPGVEQSTRDTAPVSWEVSGLSRAEAWLISRVDDNPVYGGTPSDTSVIQTIRELRRRGFRVTFYPFVLMDVPAGNTLPDPYSDHAAAIGQPAFPWRGRITGSPAPGYAGSVDQTPVAATQVAAFFGAATPSDFDVMGERVAWTGGADAGYARMILHYAHLCAAAGGVDAFLIGSELRGITTLRSDDATYPAVAALSALAADARGIFGPDTAISYAADWSEYFGHHPDDGSGDVHFHLDPLWADPNITFVGIDNYMPLSDWRDGPNHLDAQAGARSIYDADYLRSNVAGGEGFDWYYASASDRAAQIRKPITDGAHGKPWVFRSKDLVAWWSNPHFDRPGGVEAGAPTPWLPRSKPIRFTELGCPAIDRGTNQPNVFVDPKSSESFVPYFSRGWRDDAIQRAYLEAVLGYWDDPDRNPVSPVYGGRMLDLGESAVWSWDARPYPHFPVLTEVWSDGGNWRLGHWLTGRLGAASLRALVRKLCVEAGLPDARLDVTDLKGAARGYVITGIESPRTSIAMLARHFGFDACESEGVLRFVSRGQAPALRITPDELVRAGETAEVLELVRGQESELSQALKWQLARDDEEYDAVVVEARRATVDSARIASETFPIVVSPEEADRRCRRALAEAWAGRESASFTLPPSRLALDPTDVVALDHDGRALELRLSRITDGAARRIEAIRQDRAAYDLPPLATRGAKLTRPVLFPAPTLVFLDLPVLTETSTPYRPLLAAGSDPWPGRLAVYRSEDPNEGFELLTTLGRRARIGTLAFDLHGGPVHRFDRANALYLDLGWGELTSITDTALFAGGNALALETAPGAWEIVQAGTVDLIAAGRYRLTRLLRGQRGTEGAMASVVASGARVVVLDAALTALPIAAEAVGAPAFWRVGPVSKGVGHASYAQVAFTPNGVGAEPFAGVHVAQPWRRGRAVGDLVIDWIRRSRDPAADVWGRGEVPLGEEAEAYEVDIFDGAAVRRTLSATTTRVTYTGADQIADWGAPLGPGDRLNVAIFEIAPVAGRGAPTRETLIF